MSRVPFDKYFLVHSAALIPFNKLGRPPLATSLTIHGATGFQFFYSIYARLVEQI